MSQRRFVLSLSFLVFCAPQIAWGAMLDSDHDGLSDEQEKAYYTDPQKFDTDGDGFDDGMEVEAGYSPLAGDKKQMHEFDFDNDGLNDWLEGWFKSDRGKPDTDGDGYTDFTEVMKGYSPSVREATAQFRRQIVVDRATQRLSYLVDGVKILNLPISTGNPGSETPAGEYKIEKMIPVKRYSGPGYDLAGVKWNMQFRPMYYLHGAYWHNDFGIRTHSHGCVNLRDADAELLYGHMDVGVPVSVIGTTPKKFIVGT